MKKPTTNDDGSTPNAGRRPKKPTASRGVAPDRVRIEGMTFEDAVRKAMSKPAPTDRPVRERRTYKRKQPPRA